MTTDIWGVFPHFFIYSCPMGGKRELELVCFFIPLFNYQIWHKTEFKCSTCPSYFINLKHFQKTKQPGLFSGTFTKNVVFEEIKSWSAFLIEDIFTCYSRENTVLNNKMIDDWTPFSWFGFKLPVLCMQSHCYTVMAFWDTKSCYCGQWHLCFSRNGINHQKSKCKMVIL